MIKQLTCEKCFGGFQYVFEHDSRELSCKMKFSVFVPSIAKIDSCDQKLPVIYWLSGLTCTEQNFIIKSGFQRYAEQYGAVVIGPDTSPRGVSTLGDEDSWDLGTGAGFYVDASEEPWKKHYRMYSYVTKELPEVVEKNFPVVDKNRCAISGHSMGGHGALVCFLRNPEIYKAVSAFAPISNPCQSEWGRKAFRAYLGGSTDQWANFDATEYVQKSPRKDTTILIEQGSKDEWMSYLVPDNFVEACKSVSQPLIYNYREGYAHGYHFVSTFIGDHIKFLVEQVNKSNT